MKAPARDGAWAAALGLAVRLAVAAWGGARFPPAEDGHFYHVVAGRIARGLGYTWLWPDGAVTYAAHYPVGYPALVGALYAVTGPVPEAAMVLSAVLGAAAVFAVHRVAARGASRAGALVAALLIALHPGLVLYTPALMTEGVTASLLAVAAALAVGARPCAPDAGVAAHAESRSGTPRPGFLLVLAFVAGVAVLVRPQSLLLAPLFGAVAAGARRPRATAWVAALVTAGAITVCVPWTLRNCTRMKSCALVSVNAGWNLYIGAARGATGAWVPLERLGVPAECRTVWDEAAKDACFLRAGERAIENEPLRWMSLVPRKLAATFDYAGAAGFYLHSSNPGAFGDRAKLALGVVETAWERAIVALALLAVARVRGPRLRARRAVAAVSALTLLVRPAFIAHLGLVVAAALFGRRLAARPVLALAAGTVLGTALVHAAFFGAGRYSLVCFPALAALAGTALTGESGVGDTDRSKES
jgi:hypothetical protein